MDWMKRFSTIVGIAIIVVVLVLASAITLTIGWRPFIGPKARPLSQRTFERTPQRLERGRYLAENLGCFDCHGEHDWKQHDAPLLPGTKGEGNNFPLEG